MGKSEGCGEQERRENQFRTHHQFYHCWWWLVSGLTRTFSGALWNASQDCLPGRTNGKHCFTGSCAPWVQADFLTLTPWYFWAVMKYQGVTCCTQVWPPVPRWHRWLLLVCSQLWVCQCVLALVDTVPHICQQSGAPTKSWQTDSCAAGGYSLPGSFREPLMSQPPALSSSDASRWWSICWDQWIWYYPSSAHYRISFASRSWEWKFIETEGNFLVGR